MSRGVQAPWLPALAALAGERLGLDFPPERWSNLERCIQGAARETGADTEAFVQSVLAAAPDDHQIEVLAHALTIGETYFFRERRSFDVLEQEILPPIIAARQAAGRRLRLWSAGCCTGEEAYSLAILLDRLLPQRDGWHITILATDVNPRFLRAASRGEFGAWSFRDAPPGLKERYFKPIGTQRFVIDPRIRGMVRFSQLNLVEPLYPNWGNDTHSMDVILCRNVLMYLTPALTQQVLGRFEGALVDGGWLSVSATETSPRNLNSLTLTRFDGVAFYRKGGVPPPAARRTEAWDAVGAPLPAAPTPILAPEAVQPWAAVGAPATPAAQPDGEVDLLRQARAHADSGRLDLACKAVEQAIEDAKLDAGAHHLHALILDELGRDIQACEALKRAIYLEPDFVLAHHVLGQFAQRQGRAAEAQRHFATTLRLLARHDAQAVLAHSGGLSAGHLKLLIEAALARMGPA